MSILIPTRKKESEIITLKFADWEVIFSVHTCGSDGLSRARNKLRDMAERELMIYMDDDLLINDRLWEIIGNLTLDTMEGQIFMAQGGNHPISRVMILTKTAFDDIGGFDEQIKYNGEDYDFYLRALAKGYFVNVIPSKLIKHIPHRKSNWARYHFESPVVRIKHHKVGVNFFVYRNPLVMALRMAGYIYYKYIKGVNPKGLKPESENPATNDIKDMT